MTEIPKYPKIETLFERDDKTHKVTDNIRLPEFETVNRWLVTEKIDGTNIRVHFEPAIGPDEDGKGKEASVAIAGRTDRAQIPPDLLAYLTKIFSLQECSKHLSHPVTLFGEGYGARIQKGGKLYRSDVGFRLFDVLAGNWWLRTYDVVGIADAFGILPAPVLGIYETDKVVDMVRMGFQSTAAVEDGGEGREAEGVVARSEPLLLMRNGIDRVMWKLKTKDFPPRENSD